MSVARLTANCTIRRYGSNSADDRPAGIEIGWSVTLVQRENGLGRAKRSQLLARQGRS